MNEISTLDPRKATNKVRPQHRLRWCGCDKLLNFGLLLAARCPDRHRELAAPEKCWYLYWPCGRLPKNRSAPPATQRRVFQACL